MAKENQLSKKQLAVIDDLFAGDMDEQAILHKHNITAATYHKWLTDERFSDEFNRRLLALKRQTELIIARNASRAATKLVSLINCKKEEIVRRACLDIINLPILKPEPLKADNSKDDDESQSPPISPETAGKLLAVLAEAETESGE